MSDNYKYTMLGLKGGMHFSLAIGLKGVESVDTWKLTYSLHLGNGSESASAISILEWDGNGIVFVGYGAKGHPYITEKQLSRRLEHFKPRDCPYMSSLKEAARKTLEK